MHFYHDWTDEEEEYLLRYMGKLHIKQMVIHLNLSYAVINGRMCKLTREIKTWYQNKGD